MCTVTIVATGSGVRVACNRDEQRTRPVALPPLARATPAGTLVYPVDPVSGGTWIGASDRGFAAVLLNRCLVVRRETRRQLVSRGAIVPALLAAGSFAAALSAARAMDCGAFEPFTVVVFDRDRAVAFTPRGDRCAETTCSFDAPLLFTSSSLGDHVVAPPRRALFEAMVLRARDPLGGQRRFHRHQWHAAPHLSVLMTRADAATVSRTTIDLSDGGLRMAYAPAPQTRVGRGFQPRRRAPDKGGP